MSLKIRLSRAGAKKRPFYRIVVADARAPRDGRFVEKLGMETTMMNSTSLRQRGLALPIMLIMLAVMLVSAAYLLRASNSGTLASANLAYETTLSKEADLGLAGVLRTWRDKYPAVPVWQDVVHGHPAHVLGSYSARADLANQGRLDRRRGSGDA